MLKFWQNIWKVHCTIQNIIREIFRKKYDVVYNKK